MKKNHIITSLIAVAVILFFSQLGFASEYVNSTDSEIKFRGVGIMYSSEDIITINISGGNYKNIFTIGICFNPEPGEVRDSYTSNYGRTKIDGKEESYYGLDFGYSRRVARHLRLGIEGSFGYETEYEKFRDYRFTEDYYLDETDRIIGIPLTDNFEIITSINSIKGFSGGIMFIF